jgi:hypothetical protein
MHANPICFTYVKIISVGVAFVGNIANKCWRSYVDKSVKRDRGMHFSWAGGKQKA